MFRPSGCLRSAPPHLSLYLFSRRLFGLTILVRPGPVRSKIDGSVPQTWDVNLRIVRQPEYGRARRLLQAEHCTNGISSCALGACGPCSLTPRQSASCRGSRRGSALTLERCRHVFRADFENLSVGRFFDSTSNISLSSGLGAPPFQSQVTPRVLWGPRSMQGQDRIRIQGEL